MKIDLQREDDSIIIGLDDGEKIEFTKEDLSELGIDADKAVELAMDGLPKSLN